VALADAHVRAILPSQSVAAAAGEAFAVHALDCNHLESLAVWSQRGKPDVRALQQDLLYCSQASAAGGPFQREDSAS